MTDEDTIPVNMVGYEYMCVHTAGNTYRYVTTQKTIISNKSLINQFLEIFLLHDSFTQRTLE